jgi:hypothetical protein
MGTISVIIVVQEDRQGYSSVCTIETLSILCSAQDSIFRWSIRFPEVSITKKFVGSNWLFVSQQTKSLYLCFFLCSQNRRFQTRKAIVLDKG